MSGIDLKAPPVFGAAIQGEKTRPKRPRIRRSVRPDAEVRDDGEGNWLLSYADMMTLLFGFFVMLQSFSTINPDQFEKVKKETTKVFGGEYKVPYETLVKRLKDAMRSRNLDSQVAFFQTDAGLEISFRGALFFDSGTAELKPAAQQLLTELVPIIAQGATGFGIVVEGHTDDASTHNSALPSNWELSGLRACRVLRIFEQNGIRSDHLKAVGWGDTHPVAPNEDAQGNPIEANRAQNRRVVIKILKNWEA